MTHLELTNDQKLNKVINVGTLYPNPANNLTTMNFELASTANLNLTVTDIFGKVVYTANDTYFEGNNSIEISSPMYATAVGLVMNSTKVKKINKNEESENNIELNNNEIESETIERTTIFERFTQSLKTFLDNAE